MSEPTTSEQTAAVNASKPRQLRLAIPLALVALYWIAFFGFNFLELATFQVFLYRVMATLALIVTFTLWWLFNRGMSWGEKFAIPIVAAAGFGLAFLIRSPELELKPVVSVLMFILAVAMTLATLWMLLARHAIPASRRRGLIAIGLLIGAPIAVIPTSGMIGGVPTGVHGRWTPRA